MARLSPATARGANAVDVRVEDVRKRYGPVEALRGVSLAFAAGRLTAILGPSGCGKTTLLRAIAGFVRPDTGTVRFAGEDVTARPPQERASAMVFQSYALWPHMTVAQNVGYGLRFAGVGRADRDRRVDEMLRAVQLAGYGARYPGELSGGQQQRVAVARALVVEPEILLLDEPLSNLDASLREEMRFEIRRLHERFSITTLYVTHDQAEAMVISDRVAVLRDGRVAQIGPPAELFERPRTRFVAEFVGKTNLIDAIADGPGWVRRGGLRLRVTGEALAPSAASSTPPATPVVVSIRPHQIALGPRGAIADASGSVLAGTVVRASYLGDAVDYQVALDGSDVVLRIAGPAPARVGPGQAVSVVVPAAACVLLPAGD